MSWSRRQTLRGLGLAGLGLGVAGLTGCGFAPVYAPGGPGGRLTNAVMIETNNGFYDYTLRQELQERLGPATRPEFHLKVGVTLDTDSVAVTKTQVIERYNVVGKATYSLTDLDGNVVASGTDTNFTSYSATGTTIATQAGQDDAYRRLMVILADDIMNRLILAMPVKPAS